jgi:hypothetical protein
MRERRFIMGVLTQDITRLRNEILALRNERRALVHDLERETRMRQTDVSQMLAQFSKDCGAAARRMKTCRLDSITDLQETVSGILTGVRSDLSGIRKAWMAMGSPRHRSVAKLEVQAGRKTAPHTKGRPSETGGKRSTEPFQGEKHAERQQQGHRLNPGKAATRPISSGKRKKPE